MLNPMQQSEPSKIALFSAAQYAWKQWKSEEEAKKVNKAILEASIATLESKLSTAKYADATVVAQQRKYWQQLKQLLQSRC